LASRSGGYNSGSGTSFSASIVSGVAGLVLSANPALTGRQVMNILQRSADDLGTTGYDVRYGWGRVNAAKAVAMAKANQDDFKIPLVGLNVSPTYVGVSNAVVGANFASAKQITKLEYYVDNKLAKTLTIPLLSSWDEALQKYVTKEGPLPCTFVWPITLADNGYHTIYAKAYDTDGNVGTSTVYNTKVQSNANTTVTITSPAPNATVSGKVTITANATSDAGIAKVQLLSGSTMKYQAKETTSPYTMIWDTTTLTPGKYTMTVKAFDNASTVNSKSIDLIVGFATGTDIINLDITPPTISITSPATNSIVKELVPVTVNAKDETKMSKVELLIDGSVIKQSTTAPYTQSWDTNNYQVGDHTITAKAYDTSNNSTLSAPIKVSLIKVTTPPIATTTPTTTPSTLPVVSIVSPTANATVSGKVTLTANATSDLGILKVQLYGGLVGGSSSYLGQSPSTASPYTLTWDTTTLTAGQYKLMVKAWDLKGSTTAQTIYLNVQPPISSRLFQKFLSAVRTIIFR